MPRKLVLEPQKIKKKIANIKNIYGNDVLSKVGNLYFYCFCAHPPYLYSKLEKAQINSNSQKALPLAREGSRENAMVYVYLLSEFLIERKAAKNKKEKGKTSWEDAVFVIYFTYYTGFTYDTLNDLDYDVLSKVLNKQNGFSNDLFKSSFKGVSHFNFHLENDSINNLKIKRSLIEKVKSFKKKYKNHEQVEFFKLFSSKIMQNSL